MNSGENSALNVALVNDKERKVFFKRSTKEVQSYTTDCPFFCWPFLAKRFEKRLELIGTGYKANVSGKKLVLSLGFSHDINFEIPEGISIKVEKNIVVVTGTSKQLVGQVAAEIKSFRKPEPYKGKGVRYEGERIYRKEGKKK